MIVLGCEVLDAGVQHRCMLMQCCCFLLHIAVNWLISPACLYRAVPGADVYMLALH
jgi:hypothetical protein